MLYLASDHAGFELKETLKLFLKEENIEFEDLSSATMVPEDDYPEPAIAVAKKVATEKDSRGILLCGNGIGMCMTANKIPGIRAGIGYNLLAAETMRTDDNANVLCLAGRVLQPDFAKAITRKFLETNFSQAERHVRRLQKVAALDK